MKVRLLLTYKGSRYFGWQKQKNNQASIQGVLEFAILKLFKNPISVIGSGRTDRKVHALGQVAHFKPPFENLEKIRRYNLPKSLNHFLPKDIYVRSAFLAPDEFHARFSAIAKTYVFFILNQKSPSILSHDFIWQISNRKLDLEKLKKISKEFLGKKDFKSFQSRGTDVKKTTRIIYHAKWSKISKSLYSFTITGSGFLKQMVRNLVGTQINLLDETFPEKKMRQLLNQKLKDKGTFLTAPAEGLYLKHIFYPRELDRKCIKI